MTGEIWKSIRGFEGLYEASNYGRIRSLDRKVRSGNRFNTNIDSAVKKGKILKQVDIGNGYLQVCLRKNGKNHSLYVHRLVWEVFNGPIPEGMQVNHINENKSDNRLDNLNLMTAKDNSNWGTRNKRIQLNRVMPDVSLSKNPRAKKVDMLSKDGEFQKTFNCISEALIYLFGVKKNPHNVSMCCNGLLKTAYGHKWTWTTGK